MSEVSGSRNIFVEASVCVVSGTGAGEVEPVNLRENKERRRVDRLIDVID